MVGPRHALTLGLKGERSKSQAYMFDCVKVLHPTEHEMSFRTSSQSEKHMVMKYAAGVGRYACPSVLRLLDTSNLLS